MGDYAIGVVGAIAVIIVLVFSKRLIHIHPMKKLEIKYKHKVETKEFINDYFKKHNITVVNVNFKVTQNLNDITYVNIYDIETPRSIDYANIIEDLSMNKNVMEIQLVSI